MRRLWCLLCALVLCAACSEPPQKEIDRAQGAIDAARAAGAERYAPAEFTAATGALQQSHDAVQQGDYRLALSRALDASERAQAAAREAADGKARARSEAETAVSTTATSVQQLRSAMKSAEEARVPATQLAAAHHTAQRADAAVQEARAKLGKEQYLEVVSDLKGVQTQIQRQISSLSEAAKVRSARRKR
jgi:uncharacterized protein DUF4398